MEHTNRLFDWIKTDSEEIIEHLRAVGQTALECEEQHMMAPVNTVATLVRLIEKVAAEHSAKLVVIFTAIT